MSDPATGSLDTAKLAAARLWATNRFPYLASALFAVEPVVAPGLDRVMVDRWWRAHVPAEVAAAGTSAELGGELLHLTSHLLRDHAVRADAQHFESSAELHHWVDAADAEINDDFPADLERLRPAVTPDDLAVGDGRLAEEYYRHGDVRLGETNDCGSGAHGRVAGWEPAPPAPTRPPSASETTSSAGGIGEEEQRLIRRRVASDIAASDRASVPDGLRRWAADQLDASVDWRAELTAIIRRSVSSVSGAVDYSYRRPSRRAQAAAGVVLPSLRHPTVEVAVVIDTSASVSEELLGDAVAEVDGVLRATGTRSVNVVSCDDAVHTVRRVTRRQDVTLIGGGGTDMTVGLDAAAALRPPPDLIVVLTDGFTPWPDRPPPARVIVGLLTVEGALEPPAWARTVEVERSLSR